MAQGCGFDAHRGPVWMKVYALYYKSLWVRQSAKLVKCKCMKGRRQVKEGFVSLETWIVYVCHSEGEWARQKM
jgi:hypothetical protein